MNQKSVRPLLNLLMQYLTRLKLLLKTLLLNSERVDPGYAPTGGAVYAKLSVPDPLNWTTWSIAGGHINDGSLITLAEGVPFPHPFLSTGSSAVYIPSMHHRSFEPLICRHLRVRFVVQ